MSGRVEVPTSARVAPVSSPKPAKSEGSKLLRELTGGSNTAKKSKSASKDKECNSNGKPTEVRRVNKPLMEKRRRARINQSLTVLKGLILDSTKSEHGNAKHSKLEKADILELTVRYLQRQKALESGVLDKFKAGFQECTREVHSFLESPDLLVINPAGIDSVVKQRLFRHLEQCVSELDMDFQKSATEDLPKSETEEFIRPDSSTAPSGDENNNHRSPSPVPERIQKVVRRLPQKRTLLQDVSTKFNAKKPMMVKLMRDDAAAEEEKLDKEDVSSDDTNSNGQFSLLQVIPTRLADGQVVFLLPNAKNCQPSSDTSPNNVYYISSNSENSSEVASVLHSTTSEEPLDFTLRRRDDSDENVWRPW